MAQWIEYPASNRAVTGSSPVRCIFSRDTFRDGDVSFFERLKRSIRELKFQNTFASLVMF